MLSPKNRSAHAPRPHHYTFAHKALPAVLFKDPDRLLSALLDANPEIALKNAWDAVGRSAVAEADRLPGDELSAQVDRSDPRNVLIQLTLPPAIARAEAHFIAIAVREPSLFGRLRGDLSLRYFTLEHSVDITTGNDITMLCEWTAAGNHVNYGKGPAANIEAFTTAVRAKLAGH